MTKIEDPDINKNSLSVDIKDIVWAAIHYSKRADESIESALELFEVTKYQYYKYKNTYPEK